MSQLATIDIAATDLIARGGHNGPRFLFPLLLLVLLGFLVGGAVRRKRGFVRGGGGFSAMRTLQDRFARGEISRDEYEYRKAVLTNSKDIPPAPSGMTPAAPAAAAANAAPPAPPAPSYDPVDDLDEVEEEEE